MDRKALISTLHELGITPSKLMGQTFLLDETIAQNIVTISEVTNKVAIEVGPGLGILTKYLLPKVKHLILVERDPLLAGYLKRTLPASNYTLITADILKQHIPRLYKGGKVKIVSNLPYSIISPFLRWLIHEKNYIEDTTLMLPQDVVDKLLATPGTKKYSALTVIYRIMTRITRYFVVPPHVFYPRPKIFSEVIKIEFNELDLPQGFIKFVEHGFTARRKKLKNVFKQYKFDNLGDKRPDQLTPNEWLTIYNRLKRYDNR